MASSGVTVSIVVPAYNEAGQIAPVLRSVLVQLRQLGGNWELLVVDDGSTDETATVASTVDPLIRLVRHPYNQGNGAAVKSGLRHATGEIVVVMDGDGQHDPADIPRFVEACGKFDMVVGARGRGSQAGWHRGLANSIYNRFATYVTGQKIADLTSGFRAFRRDVARQFLSLLPNGFSYPTTITLCLMRAGFSVSYIPIEAARRTGKSKIKLFSDGTKFFLVIMKICMLFSPLRIFLPVSFYVFLMGLGYYGYTYWSSHRFTNMSMLLFTTSVQIFMMGLIAEQVAQMRFERSGES
jgi:glycosyltransferase involved in cell wall biosynthesis